MSCAGLQQSEIKFTRSSWTPLNDDENRRKLAHERSLLILKWFKLWPNDEKVNFLLKMIEICSLDEKRKVLDEIHRQIPQKHVDFTRYLPRVLSLYILSFLDPRSLCRIAQVCWNWKFLAEANEIWMKKCLRLGWNLPNAFAAIEHGAYKKLYINNMHYLRIVGPIQLAATRQAVRLAIEEERKTQETLEREKKKRAAKRAAQRATKVADYKAGIPWLGPSPRPKDIRRFNCLENETQTVNRSSQLTSRSAESFHSTEKLMRLRSRPSSAVGRNSTATNHRTPPPQRKTSSVAAAVTERLFKDARQRQESPTRRRVDNPAPILDIIRDVDAICRDEQRRRLSQRHSLRFGALQPSEDAATERDSFVIGPAPAPRSGRREVTAPRQPVTVISQLSPELIKALPPPPRYAPEQSKPAESAPTASPRRPGMKPPKYTIETTRVREATVTTVGTTSGRPESGRESVRSSLNLLLQDVPT